MANNLFQFIVMFRSRFTEAFPKSCPHFGPQELETDIVDNPPGDRAEALLCALLGLLLNRKQDVKSVTAHTHNEERVTAVQRDMDVEANPTSIVGQDIIIEH